MKYRLSRTIALLVLVVGLLAMPGPLTFSGHAQAHPLTQLQPFRQVPFDVESNSDMRLWQLHDLSADGSLAVVSGTRSSDYSPWFRLWDIDEQCWAFEQIYQSNHPFYPAMKFLSLSGDGSRVAWYVSTESGSGVRVADVNGEGCDRSLSNDQFISTQSGIQGDFTSDGSSFTWCNNAQPRELFHWDGTTTAQVTTPARPRCFAHSNDGPSKWGVLNSDDGEIIFGTSEDSDDGGEIWAYDVATASSTKVAEVPGVECSVCEGHGGVNSISSDGRFVTYQLNLHQAPYLLDRDTNASGVFDQHGHTSLTELPFQPGTGSPWQGPATLSANGSLVARLAQPGDYLELYDVVEGVVTDSFEPTWTGQDQAVKALPSSDGSRVVFSPHSAFVESDQTFEIDLYVVRAPTVGEYVRDQSFGNSPWTDGAADPVNTTTGNYYESTRDLNFPGHVQGLELRRHYNSLGAEGSGFGPGWTHSYEDHLVVEDDDTVTLVTSEARHHRFEYSEGDYQRSPGLPATIENVVTSGSTVTSAELEFDSGAVWHFEDGLLARLVHADGQEVVVSRTSDLVDLVHNTTWGYAIRFNRDHTFLPWVTSVQPGSMDGGTFVPDGRVITYVYESGAATGLPYLERVSALHFEGVDEPNAETVYEVNGEGQVTKVTLQAANPAAYEAFGVDAPAPKVLVTTEYMPDGRVRSQILEDGEVATFTYRDDEWDTDVTWHDPNDASVESMSLTYSYEATAGETVAVTDPVGNPVERVYDDQLKITEFTTRSGVVSRSFYDSQTGRLLQRALPDPDPHSPDAIPEPDPQSGWTRDLNAGWSLEEFTYVGSDDHRVQSLTNADGIATSYTYDGSSTRVTSVTEAVGTPDEYTTAMAYTPQGQLARVIDADGVGTYYRYDPAGNLTFEITDTDLPVDPTTYDPDPANPPATARVTSYQYTPQGWQQSVTTPEGHTTTFDYYGTGQLKSSSDPLVDDIEHFARRHLWAPDGAELASRDVEDVLRWTRVERHATGGRTETTFVAGQPDAVAIFDASGQLVEQRVGAGTDWAVTAFEYGPLQRLERTTGPDGVTTHQLYDRDGRVIARVTGDYTGDYHNLTEAPTIGIGDRTEVTVYDRAGRVIREQGPTGDVDHEQNPVSRDVAYSYDRLGRRVATIEQPAPNGDPMAGSRVNRVAYDAAGRAVLEWVDVNHDGVRGVDEPATQTVYSDGGRVREKVTPLPGLDEADLSDANEVAVVTNNYDDAGQLISVIDAEQRTTTFGYDRDGNRETVTSAQGRVRFSDFDALGRVWRERMVSPADDNAEVQVVRTFTPSGQVRTETDAHDPTDPDPAVREFIYEHGRLKTVIDANDEQVGYTYDVWGNRQTRTALAEPADPGDPLSVDVYATETWDYDPAGRLRSYTDPLERTTTWTFDDDPAAPVATTRGNLWRIERPTGRVETFAWHNSGQLAEHIATLGTDSVQVDHFYDGFGQRVAAIMDVVDTYEWHRDDMGRLTGASLPTLDGSGWSTELDLVGLRSEFTYPSGGIARYGYDKTGVQTTTDVWSAQTSLWVPVVDAEFTADGLIGDVTILGSSGTRQWLYNDAGRVNEFSQITGTATYDAELQWRPDGRLAVADVDDSAYSGRWIETYDYDPAGQLVEIAHDDDANTTIDELTEVDYGTRGERLELTSTTGGTHTYTWDLALGLDTIDRPAGTTSYDHDLDGRRTAQHNPDGSLRELTYDPAGQLVSILTDPDPNDPNVGTLRERSYDPDGNLAIITDPSQVPLFGTDTIVVVVDPTTLEIIEGGDEDLTRYTRLHHGHGLAAVGLDWGSGDQLVTAAIDHQGSTLGSPAHSYDPWGNYTKIPSYLPSTFHSGYRGEVHIDGLVHLRNRDYDTTTGTFTTKDPLDGVNGTPTVANPYHYTDNDPLNKTDPTGLRPTDGDDPWDGSGGCFGSRLGASRAQAQYTPAPPATPVTANPNFVCSSGDADPPDVEPTRSVERFTMRDGNDNTHTCGSADVKYGCMSASWAVSGRNDESLSITITWIITSSAVEGYGTSGVESLRVTVGSRVVFDEPYATEPRRWPNEGARTPLYALVLTASDIPARVSVTAEFGWKADGRFNSQGSKSQTCTAVWTARTLRDYPVRQQSC